MRKRRRKRVIIAHNLIFLVHSVCNLIRKTHGSLKTHFYVCVYLVAYFISNYKLLNATLSVHFN